MAKALNNRQLNAWEWKRGYGGDYRERGLEDAEISKT